MSSKSNNDDLEPPSYNDAMIYSQTPNHNPLHSSVQNEVHNELLNLAITFSSTCNAKQHQLQREDDQALALLVPQVKAFLAEYSTTTLPKATLILIPAGTVAPHAVPADDDLRSADDFGRVVAVAHEKGGDAALWESADAAQRLASCLRPRSGDELPLRPERVGPSVVESAGASKKASWWKRSPAAGTSIAAVPANSRVPDLPKVTMVVEAEEVVFRVESELGLFENQTVWGIVIRIQVNAGKSVYCKT